MAQYCTEKTVYDAALDRIREIYDNFDEVFVSMSGGKDSTVVFHLALTIARERNRLPLKVFWLDQECEWQATVDYMNEIMRLPDVKPYWYQIPLRFTNSTSHINNFLSIWDEKEKNKWCHDQSDISIKVNPTGSDRFHDCMNELSKFVLDEKTKRGCVLCGLRVEENPVRRMLITGSTKGNGWILKYNEKYKVSKAYPIWDWTFSDVWVAISKNKWNYNKIYDYQYRYGLPMTKMRVSALIHETAWKSLEMLQEFEPKTYNKFVQRIYGVSTISHMSDQGCDTIPSELPYMFVDWKEYRDYLLVNLVKKEYHDLFKKRWQGQDGDDFYKMHCKEVVINDIDGTINKNFRTAKGMKKSEAKRDKQDYEKLKEQLSKGEKND